MKRLTQTGKWKDSWFLSLSRDEKLMFMFLTENCDEAGFYELDWRNMPKLLGYKDNEIKDIKKILNNIKKSFIVNAITDNVKVVTKIWLKKFLFHQEMLPLNLNDTESKKAYWLINENLEFFGNHPELLKITSQIPVSLKKRTNKVFVPPEYEDLKTFYRGLGETNDNNILELYNYWISCGWKVGNKPMVDWKAAARNAYLRKNRYADKNNTTQKPSRLNTIKDETKKTLQHLNVNNEINTQENQT